MDGTLVGQKHCLVCADFYAGSGYKDDQHATAKKHASSAGTALILPERGRRVLPWPG